MNTNTITTFCELGAVLSVGCWFLYQRSISKTLHEQLRETSRFPLFAARDQLVALVAEGRVREDDEAWSALYGAVNSMLGMHQKLHTLDIAVSFTRCMLAMAQKPELRKQFDRERQNEETLAAKVPAFAAARDAVNSAMFHLIKKRTNALHEWLVVAFVLGLRVAAIAIRFGLAPAMMVGSAVLRPSPLALRNWQSAQREHLHRVHV
jgi:hypothetical protein